MTKRFKRNQQPDYIAMVAEYKKLGVYLKETTREKLAEKLNTNTYALTALQYLDDDDIRLLRLMFKDRREMLERRAALRELMAP